MESTFLFRDVGRNSGFDIPYHCNYIRNFVTTCIKDGIYLTLAHHKCHRNLGTVNKEHFIINHIDNFVSRSNRAKTSTLNIE